MDLKECLQKWANDLQPLYQQGSEMDAHSQKMGEEVILLV